MSARRIAVLVLGSLLALPGIGLLGAGAALGAAYLTQRDDDGFFEVSVDQLESDTVAITAEELDLDADPGTPSRLFELLDVDVRLRIRSADGAGDVFVGIAAESDVDRYLAGVAHDEIQEFDNGTPTYRARPGDTRVEPPTNQSFWQVSAAGPGTQVIDWEAAPGRWAVVLMNADGSAGVATDVDVGVRAGFLVPLMITLLAVGAVVLITAVGLIVVGGVVDRRPPAEVEAAVPGVEPVLGGPTARPDDTPVTVTAQLDPDLSPWLWLVKWILAIPHVIVLFFLWIAFVVLTVIAGFSVLFTGRYPRAIFDFNVGVLRWSWRVSYYASTGGIGTDRYPPFTLAPDAGYPASLDVEYPERLSRWLVLVKWWLLAIPHYLIVSIIAGGAIGWSDGPGVDSTGGVGLLSILVIVAGVTMLVTGRYPRPLFGLIVGLNRWIYRVVAYGALMTDRYPPFRLDLGGSELGPAQPEPEPPQPISSGAELDEPVPV